MAEASAEAVTGQALASTPDVDVSLWASLVEQEPLTATGLEKGHQQIKQTVEALIAAPFASEDPWGRFSPKSLAGLDETTKKGQAGTAVRGLALAHSTAILEIARLGSAIASGLARLQGLPEFSKKDPQGAALYGVLPQIFAESVQELLSESKLNDYTTGAGWDDRKFLIAACKRFPDKLDAETDLDQVLLSGTKLDMLTRIQVSGETQTTFDLLPPVGRVLYVAVNRYLAGREDLTKATVYHLQFQKPASAARNFLRTSTAAHPEYEFDQIRWMLRFKLLVFMELCIYRALREVYDMLRTQDGWTEQDCPAFQYDQKRLGDEFDKHLDKINKSQPWVYGDTLRQEPEAAKTQAGAHDSVSAPRNAITAGDGMRFLESQMRAKFSNYRMPKMGSPQESWVHWFAKVEDLANIFPIPPRIIAENLLTGVSDDDVRVYGWRSKVERFALDQQPWTIQDFLTHIRGQVLSTVTTRKAAWDELQALKDTYGELSDCIAFSTRLRKLYQQIFDPSSTEVEPASRLQCVRCIHKLLTDIHVKRANFPVARAWKNYTLFDSTKVFLEYVDQDKHNPSETERVSGEFLTHVCAMLCKAHDIYTQMGAAQVLMNPPQRQGRVNQMFMRGRGRQPPRFHTDAGHKRGRSTESGRSGASDRSTRGRTGSRFSGRGANTGRGASTGRGGGRGTPQDAPPHQDASFAEVVEVLSQQRPELEPPYLRNLADIKPTMTHEECMAAIREGKCVLCQNAHSYRQCPLLQKGHPQRRQAHSWLDAYRRARLTARDDK